MYKNRKYIGILLLLIIILSWISPSIKVLAAGTDVIKANSKFKDVTYRLNSDAIQLPNGIDYELNEKESINYEEYDESSEVTKNTIRRKISIPRKGTPIKPIKKSIIKGGSKTLSGTSKEEPIWNRATNYEPVSITMDSKTMKKISPEVGKVYFDTVNQTTFKVVGKATTNSNGLMDIPVIMPQITEVFQDVNIPEQTISLSEDDITYIHPQVEVIQTSSLETNLASKNEFIPSDKNVFYKIKLDDLTLIEVGTDKDNRDEDEAREKKINDDKKKNIWLTEKQKKQNAEEQKQREEDRRSELKQQAIVKITEGYVKIFDPRVSASLDWEKGIFYADAKADIDIESDITIEGEINISREIEILIQGFEIDFVAGKVAAGIYLVIGIDGNLTFSVRTQQTGTATIGASARSILIPMVIYPNVDYTNTSLNSEVIVSGRLTIYALAMPKVSLRLLSFDILDASFKIGIEANASFNINVNESETFRLWIDLYLQLKLKVIGVGERIPFEKRINLYDKTKTRNLSEIGQPIDGGGDSLRKQKGHILIETERMDAVRDIITGSVTKSQIPGGSPISCKGDKIKIKILHIDNTTNEHEVVLGEEGRFYLNEPITPLDMVSISYNKADIKYDYNTETPYQHIEPPYIVNEIFPDAFNNKIFGETLGEIYGPNGIAFDGDEVKYNGDIYISIKEDKNKDGKLYNVTVDENGNFSKDGFIIKNTDLISAGIIFENAQIETELKKPELGLAVYHNLTEAEDGNSFTIIGAIQNLNGNKLYKESVKLYREDGTLLGEMKAKTIDEIIVDTKPSIGNAIIPTKAGELEPKSPRPKILGDKGDLNLKDSPRIQLKDALVNNTEEIPSTIFEFEVDQPVKTTSFSGGAYLELEYKGVKKRVPVIGKTKLPEIPVLEKAVVSPIGKIINSIINPAMGRSMNQSIKFNVAIFQGESASIDTNENRNVFYSMVQAPIGESNIYSFEEGDIRLSAQGKMNGIELSWDVFIRDNQIEGYNLYRGTTSDGQALRPINSSLIKDSKYLDTKIVSGTAYYYICSVVYKNGDEFIISNQASVKNLKRINK